LIKRNQREIFQVKTFKKKWILLFWVDPWYTYMKSIKIRELKSFSTTRRKKLDRLNKKIFDVCIKIIYADINYSWTTWFARRNISKIVLLHGPLIRTDDTVGNDENSRENRSAQTANTSVKRAERKVGIGTSARCG